MDIPSLQTGPLGVNTYVLPLAGQAVLIVDPAGCQFTGDEKSIVNYLDEHDLVPVGILLTHGHFDHVCGLKSMRSSYPGIPIAVQKADAECLGKNSREVQAKSLGGMYLEDESDYLDEISDLPDVDFLLDDGDTLDKYFTATDIISAFTGDSAPDVEAVLNSLSHYRVIHTPGHTSGSSCFYNESEKILISGDTIFYRAYGRTDLYGGNEALMQQSLENVFKTIPGDTLVFPGHGEYGFELEANL